MAIVLIDLTFEVLYIKYKIRPYAHFRTQPLFPVYYKKEFNTLDVYLTSLPLCRMP